MSLETAKDKIRLSQIVAQKQELLTIGGDVIVNDVKPDILKVISTTGTVCVYKKEVLNGKIKIEGCINTYIIYLADDEEGSIRTINTNLDFAEIIDLEKCKEGMTLEDTLTLAGFETRVLNGRKLHVKAFIDANLKVFNSTEIEIIVDIQNDNGEIQILNKKKDVLSLIDENTGKTTLKETINLNSQEDFAEIMKVEFLISNITTKTSFNKVLIKANANINIMYLTEDNQIKDVNSVIPIMGFIDMQDVSDTSKCIPKISLKNLVVRQNSDEENSIYVEADLNLYCRAFESKEINIIEDVYSIAEDVILQKREVMTKQRELELINTIKVKEKIDDPDLIYSSILGVNTKVRVNSLDIEDGRIKYHANLNAEFIVRNDNNVNTIIRDFPFEYEITNTEINNRSNVETELNIISKKTSTEENSIVLDAEVEIKTLIQNDEGINFTENLELIEPQDKDIYSMVIYFVKAGDTLWKIAKQFRSRVEDIARVNGIEDENKIYPGEQLYIPKFTRNQIAI